MAYKLEAVKSETVKSAPGIVLFRLAAIADEIKTAGGIVIPQDQSADNPSLAKRAPLHAGVVIDAGEHHGQKGSGDKAHKAAGWLKKGQIIWVLPHNYYQVKGLSDSACDIHACRAEDVWVQGKE